MIDLIHGDCLEVMRGLDDESIDFVFTDPPYGHTENGSLQQRREAVLSWGDGVGNYRPGSHSPIVINDGPEANDLFRESLVEIRRLLKPGACCCCCCGGGGTTAAVCEKLGRSCISIEIDEKFHEMSKERVGTPDMLAAVL